MGDYDYSNSRKSCLFCHKPGSGEPSRRHNVKFLRNSVERINFPNGAIWIGGIDQGYLKQFFFEEKFSSLKESAPAIILAHNPLAFDAIDENQDVYVLAGDTHGGQIPLPTWVWKILGYEKNKKYNQGFFRQGQKKMYVSRGIGTSHVPIRLFRRPELVVLHF
jgi:predicted MPP superfamily phosphohydrolase